MTMKDLKRLLFLLALALCLPATAQIPQEEEDLMELYGASEEYREMQRQMQDYLDREARAEQKRETTRTLMLVLSLAVAVVPICSIGKKIIDHPEVRTVKGVASALGIGLLGGAVLFGLNYGWMYLRFEHGDAITFPMALLITLGLAGFAIFLLHKKDKNN